MTNGATQSTEMDATVKDTQKSSGHNKADPGGNCQLTTAHTRSSEEVVARGGGWRMEKKGVKKKKNSHNQGLLMSVRATEGRGV